jgi:serine kinase of HPr protein (carbohydrate metabolism regulator)
MSIISEFHEQYAKENRKPIWETTETTTEYPNTIGIYLQKIATEMEEQNKLTRIIENRKLGRSILY